MNDVFENRSKVLDDIKNFIDETQENISSLLKSLDWDYKHSKNQVSKRCECPYNNAHIVGRKRLREHIESCKIKANCCNKDKLLPENFNRNSTTVSIDPELSACIIAEAAYNDPSFKRGIPYDAVDNRPTPLSANQLMSIYTADERKALYDYVISKTIHNRHVSEDLIITQNEKNKGEKSHTSYLEEMAMLRDMKRRRTKYKVSTKSKSYTEVMREVIENQMQSQREWIESSANKIEDVKDRKDSGRKHKNRHEAREDTSLFKKKHKHKSHKSKHKKNDR